MCVCVRWNNTVVLSFSISFGYESFERLSMVYVCMFVFCVGERPFETCIWWFLYAIASLILLFCENSTHWQLQRMLLCWLRIVTYIFFFIFSHSLLLRFFFHISLSLTKNGQRDDNLNVFNEQIKKTWSKF